MEYVYIISVQLSVQMGNWHWNLLLEVSINEG